MRLQSHGLWGYNPRVYEATIPGSMRLQSHGLWGYNPRVYEATIPGSLRLQSQGLWGYKLIKINYYIDFCEITRFLSGRNTIISPSENTKILLQYFERNYILCKTSHYLWSFILKCHIHRSVTFNVTNVYVLYSCIKYWNYVHVNENITELEIPMIF